MGKDRIGFRLKHSGRTIATFTLVFVCFALAFIVFGRGIDAGKLPEGVFEVRFDDTFASTPLAYDEQTHTIYWPLRQEEATRSRLLSANNGAARVTFGEDYHIDYQEPQPITVSNGTAYFDAWVQFTPLAVIDVRTDSGEAPPDALLAMGLLDYLTEADYPAGREALKTRWRKMRADAWSLDAIQSYIEENRTLIDESGAGNRDAARWSHEKPFFHIDRIEKWLSQRLPVLDAYIDAL